uniref:Uncharacterized protein n=1 Tax=Octopus bimaculoides TaxID=37653 RepID=A0A0L8FUU7_OCTBM
MHVYDYMFALISQCCTWSSRPYLSVTTSANTHHNFLSLSLSCSPFAIVFIITTTDN